MTNSFSSIKYSWLSSDLDKLSELVAQYLGGLPYAIQLDGDEIGGQSISALLVNRAQYHFIANWEIPCAAQLSVEKPDTLRLNRQFEMPDIEQLLVWLNGLPFDVCIGGSLFADWEAKESGGVLFPGQYPLGWMMAFKGAGYKYLFSSRWIDQAPVKVHRKDDVTLIQFHDLHASSAAALAQAKPGWELFNRSAVSGFLGGYSYKKVRFDGQYNPDDGGLYVTVFGREPDADELKEACYCRNFMQMQDGRSVNKIVYLFFDAVTAQKWLPELWIRGIECRTFIEGKEVILSDNYAPPSNKNISW